MLNQPFFQITLPLMVTFIATIWIAQWSQNKRFEDLKSSLNLRIDEIVKRLDKLEARLDKLEERMRDLELIRWK